ncbi:FUSC family protein [Nocardia sp. NPDC059246]|uniref:FUSC family protein n=1 Tax=unclassified Nocardia TaxID=2637762 RepID=UPI0036B1A9C1
MSLVRCYIDRGGGRAHRVGTEVWDRFSAFDPGLVRLCGAATTVGGVVLTLLVLAVGGAPVSLLVVGAWSSMVAGYTVTDQRSRDQAVTLALGIPVSIGALSVGTVLAPHHIAADAVLLVLIFTAMYVRRYGPRGSGLGDFAFQHFFMAQFVHAALAQIPGVSVVAAVAVGCSGLLRFGLVRATPERTLRRLRHAFRARLLAVIDAMADLAHARPGSPSADRAMHVLQRRCAQLHQVALLIQRRLDVAIANPDTARTVQQHIAEAEIAAEHAAIMLLRTVRSPRDASSTLILHLSGKQQDTGSPRDHAARGDEPADPVLAHLLDELSDLRRLLTRQTTAGADTATASIRARLLGYTTDTHLPNPVTDSTRELYHSIGELARAMLGLRLALGPRRHGTTDQNQTARCRAELEAEDHHAQIDDTGNENLAGLQRPTTRAALQVTVGTAIAIICGELISTEHWYWAMITCWVVFLNTTSLGEVLVKGYRRLAGTIAGVAAGAGLVTLVTGHTTTAFLLMIACMFGAFFIASVSYLLMSLLITSMVGLLYALLGTYTDTMLILRVEETAVGAAAGLIAALLVLPAHTHQLVNAQLTDVLKHTRQVITQAIAHLAGDPHVNPLDAARELDTALDTYRTVAQPLLHPASPLRTRRAQTRHTLAVLETIAYHTRSLATTSQHPPLNQQKCEPHALTRTAKQLENQLAALTESVQRTNNRHAGTPTSNLALPTMIRSVATCADAKNQVSSPALHHIERIDANIAALGRSLGLPDTEEQGTIPHGLRQHQP